MKVYRVGTVHIDLDHITGIEEPRLHYTQCYSYVSIPVIYKFTGPSELKVQIEPCRTEWPSGLDTKEQVWEFSANEKRKRYEHDEAEFRLIKYNVWAPFLTAWENKDANS